MVERLFRTRGGSISTVFGIMGYGIGFDIDSFCSAIESLFAAQILERYPGLRY